MSLFAISDLHLSLSGDKPMDVFYGWNNYLERLTSNWKRVVSDGDTVIIPGDVSWGLKLEETIKDMQFLDALPGRKILLKGNHDLWWSTITKINKFFIDNHITSIECIYNSALIADNRAICGSRGWFFDKPVAAKKVILREAGRLDVSITAAENTGLEPLVFLHYPPACAESKCNEIMDVLKKHNIKEVYHGHIHGSGFHNSLSECDSIKFKLVSCDCIDFTPFRIK